MVRTMTATEARVHFGELLETVKRGERVIVKRSGRPVAVFVPPEEYRRLTSGLSSGTLDLVEVDETVSPAGGDTK